MPDPTTPTAPSPALPPRKACWFQLETEEPHRKIQLARWVAVLLLTGIGWRLIRFGLNMPVWGDEAYIAINLLNRSFQNLFAPLDYMQVAPAGFLAAEFIMARVAGFSEFALRALPLFAGTLAAVVYWRWCKQLVSEVVVLLALGFFVLGYYPVRHSTEIKPYAFDQLASLVLFLAAALVLRQPGKPVFRWLLAACLPVAITCSFPAAFTAGACLLATMPRLWGPQRDWRAWLPWVVGGAVTCGTFALTYWCVSRGQYAQTGAPMRAYWKDAFPPANGLAFVKWFLDVHTGNMFAYPVGGKNAGSIATSLLFCLGLTALWRRHLPSVRWLLLAPFALTFIAAVLQRYPYGGSARVAQHLAPVICLAAAVGLEALFARYCRSAHAHWRAVLISLGVFLLVALSGIFRDVTAPYKAITDLQARQLAEKTRHDAEQAHALLVVAQPLRDVPVNQQYYLRLKGPPVVWDGLRDQRWQAGLKERVVWLNFDPALGSTKPPLPDPEHWFLSNEQIARIRLDPIMIPYWQISSWDRR